MKLHMIHAGKLILRWLCTCLEHVANTSSKFITMITVYSYCTYFTGTLNWVRQSPVIPKSGWSWLLQFAGCSWQSLNFTTLPGMCKPHVQFCSAHARAVQTVRKKNTSVDLSDMAVMLKSGELMKIIWKLMIVDFPDVDLLARPALLLASTLTSVHVGHVCLWKGKATRG